MRILHRRAADDHASSSCSRACTARTTGCTLDAIKQLGAGARGIAVIDENVQTRPLDEMSGRIRGIRVNLDRRRSPIPRPPRQRTQAASIRIKDRPWHLQLNTRLAVIDASRTSSERRRSRSCSIISARSVVVGLGQPGFAVSSTW